jgi:hypothetical protein
MKKWLVILSLSFFLCISGCIQVYEQTEPQSQGIPENQDGSNQLTKSTTKITPDNKPEPRQESQTQQQPKTCSPIQVPYEVEEPYTDQEMYTDTEDYVDFEVYSVVRLKTVHGTDVQNLTIAEIASDSLVSDIDVCEPKIKIFNPNPVPVAFNAIFTTQTIKGDPDSSHLHWEIQSNEEHTVNASDYLEVIGKCYIPSSKDYPYDAEVLSDSLMVAIVPNEFVSYHDEPEQKQVIKQREVIRYRPVTKLRNVTKYNTEAVCE